MKFNKITSLLLGLAMVASSCTSELNEHGLPTGDYVRLSLTGGDGGMVTRATWDDPNGYGNLSFKWESVAIDSDETNKLSLVVLDDSKALTSHASSQSGTELTYTGLAVAPKSDEHKADFETVRYYKKTDLSGAKRIHAVAGGADITVDEDNNQHIFSLEMPDSFTQMEDKNPSFLRDYMYMYATTDYSYKRSNRTELHFEHIPATFRFIIYNGTDSAISLESMSVSILDGGSVASKTAAVAFDCSDANATLSFGPDGYETITTSLSGSPVTLQNAQKYTAYSMALPLSSKEAFAGKVLSFNANCTSGETLTFFMNGETLAEANKADGMNPGIYNWVSGKSYTIKFNIGDEGKTTGDRKSVV